MPSVYQSLVCEELHKGLYTCLQTTRLQCNLKWEETGGRMHRGREKLVRLTQTEIIEAMNEPGSVEDAIFLLRDSLELKHVTFHMNVSRAGPINYPFVRTTTPEWIFRYMLMNYVSIDPVVRAGFSATEPFGWHEIQMNEREKAVITDSQAHGVGAHGHCFPTVDRFSRRSILSISGDGSLEGWLSFIEQNFSFLRQAAQLIHEKALAELSLSIAAPALAPREAECLLWTARGKDSKAIAAILEISEYTVRSYLRTARQKLECRTLSQAVAKAIQQGLIDP
nr:LuxR family transcriptional regulator [Chelativorans petroleitrophicus]